MTWVLCFFFCIGGLNSIVVYYLLKKAGVEAENFLLGGLLSLFSACVCYNIATTNITVKGNSNVSEIRAEQLR